MVFIFFCHLWYQSNPGLIKISCEIFPLLMKEAALKWVLVLQYMFVKIYQLNHGSGDFIFRFFTMNPVLLIITGLFGLSISSEVVGCSFFAFGFFRNWC